MTAHKPDARDAERAVEAKPAASAETEAWRQLAEEVAEDPGDRWEGSPREAAYALRAAADALDDECAANEAKHAKLVEVADKLRAERAAHAETKRELEKEREARLRAAEARGYAESAVERLTRELAEANSELTELRAKLDAATHAYDAWLAEERPMPGGWPAVFSHLLGLVAESGKWKQQARDAETQVLQLRETVDSLGRAELARRSVK